MPETQLPGDGTSGPDTEAPFTPKGPINEMWAARPHWVRRGEAFFHVLRVKFAHAVLLPELSPDQAYDLRQTVRQEGQLTHGYVLMCALAAGIAILGLLQSSTAVVIGAMLVSPLMSPIAAMGFGFASLDGHRIRDSIRVVAIGAGIGIATGIVLTWLSPIRNATPEILARTEPNLLDLAVALFSGIAGGYSTVIGKGGTAIGVAIATALMPPLTVIGYGIGVLQPMFALGALLLFLTNLAAITFAFALIARLSGAARPFGKVEWTPRYATILVAAFLALATPLTMTLMKLTNEARIRSAAQEAIIAACGERGVTIAQLDVSSSLLGSPKVKALVIATSYTGNAEIAAENALKETLGEDVDVSLQQVLAADVRSQTQAMVDAAMERTTAGIAADVPPYKAIRQKVGLPTRSIWTDRAQRMVYLEPVPAPDWTLADYRATEKAASQGVNGWTVRLMPPPQPRLTVLLEASEDAQVPEDAIATDLGIWALQRWGLGEVTISGADPARLTALARLLADAGIAAQIDGAVAPQAETSQAPAKDGARTSPPVSPRAITATIAVYATSPSRLEAQRAEREAAARAAALEESFSAP
ncbi:MAG: TIGR00341 family protein [Pseudomonadota bacterium]|nr:TIGR00341 family protein [Pseudomonadota bacterium]